MSTDHKPHDLFSKDFFSALNEHDEAVPAYNIQKIHEIDCLLAHLYRDQHITAHRLHQLNHFYTSVVEESQFPMYTRPFSLLNVSTSASTPWFGISLINIKNPLPESEYSTYIRQYMSNVPHVDAMPFPARVARVVEVEGGSPAYHADIRPGDVIAACRTLCECEKELEHLVPPTSTAIAEAARSVSPEGADGLELLLLRSQTHTPHAPHNRTTHQTGKWRVVSVFLFPSSYAARAEAQAHSRLRASAVRLHSLLHTYPPTDRRGTFRCGGCVGCGADL